MGPNMLRPITYAPRGRLRRSAATRSGSFALGSPMCQPCSSRPRLPRGSSRLWSGPATKPSNEMDMWQVVSGTSNLLSDCDVQAVCADHTRCRAAPAHHAVASVRVMYVDAALTKDLDDLVPDAAACAREGYDGLWVGESQHDPFLLSLRAAQAAPDVRVGTSIAIAFGRSPLTLAHSGYDLARYTDGKFVLGLGSQIRPHIERRFSMPWSHPARRMREMILALRAIWAAWHEEAPLRFEGEFYRHTLMTPNFTPPRHPAGPPPVYLAGVGERMTEVAGEVADGFLGHPFSSP